jgi:sucrose-6-phosphate hydrolase SacC (GH32 family)
VNPSATVTGDDFSNAATFTASGTSKDIALTLAHNKGTTNVTRTITVVQGSVTQTIKIVQTPLPLVATLASPFNAELANTAQSSTALLSSLKDAAGNDVLTGATLALDNASDTWVTISSQNVGIAAQESGAPARSAKIIITKDNAKTNVVISQAAGS